MQGAWRPAVVVFLVVLAAGQLAVGMRASRTASVTGDEPFYLLTMQSLSSDFDLDLGDEYEQGEERRFWDGSVPLWRQMEPQSDGRLLAPHEPGLPLAALPAYAIGGKRGVQRFLVVLWAMAMGLATVAARRAGAPPAAAGFGAVVVGIGAPGIVYASQVYAEAPAALLVAGGLVVLTGLRPRPVVMSALLVALPWLGLRYAAIGAVLAAAWAWRFRNERRAVGLLAALGGLAALHFCWWHLGTFGGLTPYSTNVVYAGESTTAIVADHVAFRGRAYRLYGLFLDARFGLVRWLPATLLAVWGISRRVVVPTGVVLTSVLVGTFAAVTMMGWWFPGRMLVAALPALAVLVALGAARLPAAAMVLGAWSLAVAFALVWSARTGGVRLAVDPFTLGVPLPPASLFPDFRHFGIREAAHSGAWIVALVGLRLAPGWARRAS